MDNKKKKQYDNQNKWIKENRSKITITIQKDLAEDIRAAAAARGQSINNYVITAIQQYMDHGNANTIKYYNKWLSYEYIIFLCYSIGL